MPIPNKYKAVVAKTASYALLRNDEDKLFTNAGAGGAIVFTLPATADVVDGWSVSFFVVADQSVTITAPSGKLVTFNNAAATSIAYSTTSEKIGGGATIVYSAADGKYFAFLNIFDGQTPVVS